MKHLRKFMTALIVLATLLAGVLFALQNEAPVPLDLLVYTFEPQSLALWILIAFVLGGILGMVVSSVILMRARASLASCRRQLDRARAEVSELRGVSPVAQAS
jgi:putative membrane protein